MGTHPIFESDFDCLTDYVNARLRTGNDSRAGSSGSEPTNERFSEHIQQDYTDLFQRLRQKLFIGKIDNRGGGVWTKVCWKVFGVFGPCGTAVCQPQQCSIMPV